MEPKYYIMLGPPGAGKGTQAEELGRRSGMAHVASGDLFREAAAQGTELGRQARSYMERGLLVPDEVTIAMIMERLDQPDCQRGVFLDGFPRTLAQAEALDQALAQRGQSVEAVLYIRVAPEVLVARLSARRTCRDCGANYNVLYNPPRQEGRCDLCGGQLYQREDDQPETVRRRLEVYDTQTAPLIEYYRRAGILLEIDGQQSIEDVQQALLRAIQNTG